jgi:DNA (cytosine-5)-methyltransferase 1
MNNKKKILNDAFKKRKNNNLNVIDLFSGCGGLSLGFKMAGYNIKAMVDFDNDSLLTAKKNNLAEHYLNLDLFNDEWLKSFTKKVKSKHVDIVIAGPPCQGFSLTGPRKINDKRNKLYKAVFDIVDKAKPKAFLIENVKGMATLYNGKVKEDIIEEFSKLGYKISTKILNSRDFGVPQSRERLFYVGLKNNNFHFPSPMFSNTTYVTCKEALSDLPSLDNLEEIFKYNFKENSHYQKLIRNSCKKLSNHQPTKHTSEVINVIKQVPEGGNHKDLPPGVGESRKFNEAWTRYDGNKPSRTIDTGHRNHFHYEYNRVPTVRENCRLQSFPDNFEICGTKTSQNKQVGNAVPVLLAKIIAEKIHDKIKSD